MEDLEASTWLTLREGAFRWCAPQLVQAVRAAEGDRPATSLPDRAAAWDPYGEPQPAAAPRSPRRPSLADAWKALAADLRARIDQGELVVTGVLIRPTAETASLPLPQVWAGAMEFDFERSSIAVDDRRYLHVRVSRQLPDATAELTLSEALLRWSDPALVERVEREERLIPAYDMIKFHKPSLLPEDDHRKPGGLHWAEGGPHFRALQAAWDALEQDFSHRVVRQEIYLRGVQVEPEIQTDPRPIPNALAGEFQYILSGNKIRFGRTRFTAVMAARTPFAEPMPRSQDTPAPVTPEQPQSLTPADVPDLDDETILALLEEHGRRVVSHPDAKLIAPGKVSFIPIIKRKMEHRAAHEGLLPKISQEAEFLADWIASKITHHQLPTASTIGKTLGKHYGLLRARSNAAIQKSKG